MTPTARLYDDVRTISQTQGILYFTKIAAEAAGPFFGPEGNSGANAHLLGRTIGWKMLDC